MAKPKGLRLRALVLALHQEASITAAAKGLPDGLAQRAALQETASLASATAGETVTEEDVMRILLRTRRLLRAPEEAAAPPPRRLRMLPIVQVIRTMKERHSPRQ